MPRITSEVPPPIVSHRLWRQSSSTRLPCNERLGSPELEGGARDLLAHERVHDLVGRRLDGRVGGRAASRRARAARAPRPRATRTARSANARRAHGSPASAARARPGDAPPRGRGARAPGGNWMWRSSASAVAHDRPRAVLGADALVRRHDDARRSAPRSADRRRESAAARTAHPRRRACRRSAARARCRGSPGVPVRHSSHR